MTLVESNGAFFKTYASVIGIIAQENPLLLAQTCFAVCYMSYQCNSTTNCHHRQRQHSHSLWPPPVVRIFGGSPPKGRKGITNWK